jgi:hypothetical protein
MPCPFYHSYQFHNLSSLKDLFSVCLKYPSAVCVTKACNTNLKIMHVRDTAALKKETEEWGWGLKERENMANHVIDHTLHNRRHRDFLPYNLNVFYSTFGVVIGAMQFHFKSKCK